MKRMISRLLREFLKQKAISKAALTDIKFKGGKITDKWGGSNGT